ncbi:MAG: SDR family oxidoreductase [Bacteroidia bacterium]|nr:SDR family oxidoreductase [Bacteroidia bacterium]
MKIDLSHKSALVCGGSKGIGFASAKLLAESGCRVILLSRNESDLKSARQSLPVPAGQNHSYIACDMNDTERLKNLTENLIQRIGPIHILVNNSGGPAAGPLLYAQTEEFTNAIRQHLLSAHVLVQTLVNGMKQASYGRIINIISTSVKQPLPNLGVSNTLRGAMANWSKTLANELGIYGITVNNVLPGATRTERLESLIEKKSHQHQMNKEEVEKEMMEEIPMKRFARPEEVAAAVLFLASPLASYINGINLPVDGGRTSSL